MRGEMTDRLSELLQKEEEVASVACAKENKEIALSGPLKDTVRKVTRAASGTAKKRKERRRE